MIIIYVNFKTMNN